MKNDSIGPDSSNGFSPGSLLKRCKDRVIKGWKKLFPGGFSTQLTPEIPVESPELQIAHGVERESFINHLVKAREVEAEEAMTPRADIIGFEETASMAEISQIIQQNPHSCYPVFRGSLDDIVGTVNVCDLVPALVNVALKGENFHLKPFVKEGVFVAPSLRLFDILIKMQEAQSHFLLVVDEYGGIDGILTLSDVMEEMGEGLEDVPVPSLSPKLIERQDGSYLIDARLELGELEAKFGPFLLPEERQENIETIGGLLSFLAGRVPSRGQLIQHKSGFEFEIIEADPRRVKWIGMGRSCLLSSPDPAP
jgi:CBS domain containing-hemolysin-like protein